MFTDIFSSNLFIFFLWQLFSFFSLSFQGFYWLDLSLPYTSIGCHSVFTCLLFQLFILHYDFYHIVLLLPGPFVAYTCFPFRHSSNFWFIYLLLYICLLSISLLFSFTFMKILLLLNFNSHVFPFCHFTFAFPSNILLYLNLYSFILMSPTVNCGTNIQSQ